MMTQPWPKTCNLPATRSRGPHRRLPGAICLALALMLVGLPSILEASGEPGGPNKCAITNYTLNPDDVTLLLEGAFCKKETRVWIGRDGVVDEIPATGFTPSETAILLDWSPYESIQGTRLWVACSGASFNSACSIDLRAHVDDADADPTNEIQEIVRVGDEVCLQEPDGDCASIEDDDADPDNELQQLGRSGSDVSLSRGGGVVSIDDADADPDNELQQLGRSGSDVSLSRGGGVVSIDDADADPENELQDLSYDESTNVLSVSGGNSVDLGELDDVFVHPDGRCSSLQENGEVRFLDCGNGTVTDQVTGLIWLKDMSCTGLADDWKAAMEWAQNLADGQCGLTDGSRPGDWRLPSKTEYEVLMAQGEKNRCEDSRFPNAHGGGCLSEGDPFTGTRFGQRNGPNGWALWSSTVHWLLVDHAYVAQPEVKLRTYPKNSWWMNVWAVRGSSTWDEDWDQDPRNELQTLHREDDRVSLTKGGGSVNINDADHEPDNELQQLSRSGSDVSLSQGGGVVSIDDADHKPDNELQKLSRSGSNVSLSQGGGVVSIDDADADPANELQLLSHPGDKICIGNGNCVPDNTGGGKGTFVTEPRGPTSTSCQPPNAACTLRKQETASCSCKAGAFGKDCTCSVERCASWPDGCIATSSCPASSSTNCPSGEELTTCLEGSWNGGNGCSGSCGASGSCRTFPAGRCETKSCSCDNGIFGGTCSCTVTFNFESTAFCVPPRATCTPDNRAMCGRVS